MNVTALIAGGYALNLVTQFLDGYLTQIGLDHGLKEGNPITRFLITKLGSAGSNAIKIGAVPFVAMLIEAYGNASGCLNLPMGFVMIPVVIHNILLLKKNKISFKW